MDDIGLQFSQIFQFLAVKSASHSKGCYNIQREKLD